MLTSNFSIKLFNLIKIHLKSILLHIDIVLHVYYFWFKLLEYHLHLANLVLLGLDPLLLLVILSYYIAQELLFFVVLGRKLIYLIFELLSCLTSLFERKNLFFILLSFCHELAFLCCNELFGLSNKFITFTNSFIFFTTLFI